MKRLKKSKFLSNNDSLLNKAEAQLDQYVFTITHDAGFNNMIFNLISSDIQFDKEVQEMLKNLSNAN